MTAKNSEISHIILLLDLHAGLTEVQSKQLLEMAARKDFRVEDREKFTAMGKIDADTAAALRNSIEVLKNSE